MGNDNILTVKELSKAFGDNRVLDKISFTVERGEVVVIIGPSGTGKSTLLRCINSLTPPDEGRVWLDDREITDKHSDINRIRQDIGFVFQHFALFNHLTALGNVEVGLYKVKKLSREAARAKAIEELTRVGLREHMEKYPAELSGGQQQRVGIARSLAMDPKILILDEPTEGIQPNIVKQIEDAIVQLNRERGLGIILVEQNVPFARSASDRFLVLDKGRVVLSGKSEELTNDVVEKHLTF